LASKPRVRESRAEIEIAGKGGRCVAKNAEQIGDDAEFGLNAVEQLLGGAGRRLGIQWRNAIHAGLLGCGGIVALRLDGLMGRKHAEEISDS